MKYSETSLNRAMTKPEFCINRSLNKVPMSEMFVFNLSKYLIYNKLKIYHLKGDRPTKKIKGDHSTNNYIVAVMLKVVTKFLAEIMFLYF
jgi:hypothetical protein